MSSLLITHGQVFTLGRQNELISDGAIYIEGDTIAEVGATAALAAKYPAAERLDAAGKIVLPGSICGHTHFYGAFARGMAIPGAPATNFVEILERLWWKLDRALLWDDIRYQRADLPGGRDPPRLHDADRPPRQPERHRRQPGHHRRRRERDGAARQPVLRGDRPQRHGRRGRGHQRERALPQALPEPSRTRSWPPPSASTPR